MTPAGKEAPQAAGKKPSKSLSGKPSKKLGGKPSGRLSGKRSGRLGGKPSGRLSGKRSGRLGGRPSGRLSGKLPPAAAPAPDAAFPPPVKWFWIVIVILILASIIGIILMSLKYAEAKVKKTPYDEPFKNLRADLASTLSRPDLNSSDPPRIATEVEDLPAAIKLTHDDFNEKKKKYSDLFLKAMRTSSGPWKLHGRSIYYFSKGAKTWYDAENFCVSRDAHLASVLDDEEQNFICSQLQNNSWIGLTVKNKEGMWRWSDGSRLLTQYWSDGKPSGTQAFGESSQDCAMMVPSLTARNWNDESCHKLYSWICKENLDHYKP